VLSESNSLAGRASLYLQKRSFETLREMGGSIDILSEVGVGTTFTIKLPSVSPPDWYTNELILHDYSGVVVVDDEKSVHLLWDKKLGEGKWTKIEHYFELKGIEIDESKYYLDDYEFFNEDKTGLDFLVENNLANQAILVTSRYEEAEVVNRCIKHGVKLVPKNTINSIRVLNSSIETTTELI
jgi:nitrogen regulatory protein PII-like uncharacterized protein